MLSSLVHQAAQSSHFIIVAIMANYYHEARAHVRQLKNMSDDKRRKAERRAELAEVEASALTVFPDCERV